jgi:hypothetical protein
MFTVYHSLQASHYMHIVVDLIKCGTLDTGHIVTRNTIHNKITWCICIRWPQKKEIATSEERRHNKHKAEDNENRIE